MAVERIEDQMIEAIDAQINELAVQRRELTDQLAVAKDFRERSTLSDQINALGEQAKDLEAEKRKQHAASQPATRRVSMLKQGEPMEPPKFELYQRMGRNSVQAEPVAAVSMTTTQIAFNDLAFEALGVSVGDSLSIYFARNAGQIAIAKPPKGWSSSKSFKLSAATGAPAGVLGGMATFMKWAGIKPKQAKGIYHLTWDEDHKHWWFELPAGSWTKPTAGTPASGGGSSTRGRAKTSAAKRGDLPTTSPYRAG